MFQTVKQSTHAELTTWVRLQCCTRPDGLLGRFGGFGGFAWGDREEAVVREELLVVAQDAGLRLTSDDDAVHLLGQFFASDALGASGFDDLSDLSSLRGDFHFGLRQVRFEHVVRLGGEPGLAAGLASGSLRAGIRRGRRSRCIFNWGGVFLGHRSGWFVFVFVMRVVALDEDTLASESLLVNSFFTG